MQKSPLRRAFLHRVGEGTQGGMEKARRVVWMGKADKVVKVASF